MENSLRVDDELFINLKLFNLSSAQCIRMAVKKLNNNPELEIPEKYYSKVGKMKRIINFVHNSKRQDFNRKDVRAYLRQSFEQINEAK